MAVLVPEEDIDEQDKEEELEDLSQRERRDYVREYAKRRLRQEAEEKLRERFGRKVAAKPAGIAPGAAAPQVVPESLGGGAAGAEVAGGIAGVEGAATVGEAALAGEAGAAAVAGTEAAVAGEALAAGGMAAEGAAVSGAAGTGVSAAGATGAGAAAAGVASTSWIWGTGLIIVGVIAVVLILLFFVVVALFAACNQPSSWWSAALKATPVGGILFTKDAYCKQFAINNVPVADQPGGAYGQQYLGKYTDLQARQQLSLAGIGWNAPQPQTSFEQINVATIYEAIILKQGCDAFTKTKCTLVLTGGTEPDSHALGTCSHVNGFKFDVGLNTTLNLYIQTFAKAGIRQSDGAPLYLSNSGALYALEKNHWDVTVGCGAHLIE